MKQIDDIFLKNNLLSEELIKSEKNNQKPRTYLGYEQICQLNKELMCLKLSNFMAKVEVLYIYVSTPLK